MASERKHVALRAVLMIGSFCSICLTSHVPSLGRSEPKASRRGNDLGPRRVCPGAERFWSVFGSFLGTVWPHTGSSPLRPGPFDVCQENSPDIQISEAHLSVPSAMSGFFDLVRRTQPNRPSGDFYHGQVLRWDPMDVRNHDDLHTN